MARHSLQAVRHLASRWVLTLGVRAGVTMTAAGSTIDYGSSYIDLRGKLPSKDGMEYRRRDPSDIEGIIWHHSATSGQTIRSIAEYHTQAKGWPEIAYHYAIGYDGRVYRLLDESKWSNHASGHNRRTIGIVLVGNYHENEPTEAMVSAAARLQEDICDGHAIKYVWLHMETKATDCPGRFAAPVLRPIQFGPKPHELR